MPREMRYEDYIVRNDESEDGHPHWVLEREMSTGARKRILSRYDSLEELQREIRYIMKAAGILDHDAET